MKAQYVCEARYSPYANALSDCKECGWPIGQHRDLPPEPTKGPFAPSTSETKVSLGTCSRCDDGRQPCVCGSPMKSETTWPPVKPGYCPNMGHKRYNMPYCTECPPENRKA